MMEAIVLVDEHWGIGCKGKQNLFISQDLKRFQEMTQGNTVILGRKTLATFPRGSPLPRRRNLILSRNPHVQVEGGEVFSSPEELCQALSPEEQVFVIGGEQVYRTFLSLCQRVYVTQVAVTLPADTYFPNLEEKEDWQLVEQSPPLLEKEYTFRYCLWEKGTL